MNVRDEVKYLLTKYPKTRNSDILLICAYLAHKHKLDPNKTSLPKALSILPSIESITRARRKAQEDNPELAPSDIVKNNRRQLEEQYRKEYSNK